MNNFRSLVMPYNGKHLPGLPQRRFQSQIDAKDRGRGRRRAAQGHVLQRHVAFCHYEKFNYPKKWVCDWTSVKSLMKEANQPATTGWFERGLEPAVLLQLTGG